ncbi:MAG: HepT-like ribonuclease domain-containing protein [Candidatus Caldarchaeum sp.]
MIKRQVIDKHLEDMATRVAHLRQYQQYSFEKFIGDWQAVYAAERGIETAVQNLIDIGAHILAALGDSQWDEYREIPPRLARHHVIPKSIVMTPIALLSTSSDIWSSKAVDKSPLYTGTQVNYVCARKLWLYSRDIRWSGLITAVNPEVGCD